LRTTGRPPATSGLAPPGSHRGLAKSGAGSPRRAPAGSALRASTATSRPRSDRGGPAASPFTSGGLSDREIEVLTLVAAGYSNSDIAERLFISSKTASVHVSHILDKLGVSTRTEAATVGVRLGLPEVDAD
jgi:DNA-binding NarL/FixJ family response regulator